MGVTKTKIKLDLLAAPEPVTEHGADWYNQRRRGIGGSDAAAVLGYSRRHSAYDVWRSKVTDVADADNESTGAELDASLS